MEDKTIYRKELMKGLYDLGISLPIAKTVMAAADTEEKALDYMKLIVQIPTNDYINRLSTVEDLLMAKAIELSR